MVTRFDKTTCRVLSDEAVKALSDLCAKHGIEVKAAGGKFQELSYTMKLEFTARAADGATQAQRDFEQYAHLFDLQADDFGKQFRAGTAILKIVGLRLNRSKYPVVGARVADGKQFLFTAESVRAQLRREVKSNG